MPIYEYKCEKCGEVFEVRQKYSDDPVTVHEKCGGTVEKLISAPSFQFKGSGWYVNDYGKGGNGAKKSESSEGKSESGDSGNKGTSDTGAAKSDSAATKSSETKSSSDSSASSTTTTKPSKSE